MNDDRSRGTPKGEKTGEWIVNEAPNRMGDSLVVTTVGRAGLEEDSTLTCPTDHPNIDDSLLQDLLDLEESQRVTLTIDWDSQLECWEIQDLR
jgi:hypothetical protein